MEAQDDLEEPRDDLKIIQLSTGAISYLSQ